MGLTPLEGLVMGTRSGDMDPAVIFHLKRVADMSHRRDRHAPQQEERSDRACAATTTCARSGAGSTRATRRAALAFDIYIHRLKKYIGAYYAVLGRVDAVAFTAGVGENAAPVREAAVAGLEELGLARGRRCSTPYGATSRG